VIFSIVQHTSLNHPDFLKISLPAFRLLRIRIFMQIMCQYTKKAAGRKSGRKRRGRPALHAPDDRAQDKKKRPPNLARQGRRTAYPLLF
jgi:hypothetical protein